MYNEYKKGVWLFTVTPFFISFSKNASPLGVPPDLKSGVKKCPNLFRPCGFAIRSKGTLKHKLLRFLHLS